MSSRRRAVVCALALGAAVCTHFALGRMLAGRDVIAGLTTHLDLASASMLLTLLFVRMFLILGAPGWVLYVVAASLDDWRKRRQRGTAA
jgi:hypothetical protein